MSIRFSRLLFLFTLLIILSGISSFVKAKEINSSPVDSIFTHPDQVKRICIKNISKNALRRLTNTYFPKLEILSLSYDGYYDSTFNFGKLFSSIKLKSIELKNLSVTYLPEQISKLSKLEYLNINQFSFPFCENLALQKIPESISKLTHLKTLILDGNDLKEFPTGVLEVYSLEYLDISNSHFTIIPPGISNLKKLKVFKAVLTKLSLPQSFCKLSELQEINIFSITNDSFNFCFPSLKKLDINFSDSIIEINIEKDMRQLSYLSIGGINNLDLKKIIRSMNHSSVDTIILDNYPSENLPMELANIKWIKCLSISLSKRNNIGKFLSNSRISKLNGLITNLKLANLGITELPKEINTLVSLKFLDISDNNLEHLPELNNLDSLRFLSISNNKFDSIPETIKSLKNITSLVLFENPKIKNLPDWVLEMKSLRTLLLPSLDFFQRFSNQIKQSLPECKVLL